MTNTRSTRGIMQVSRIALGLARRGGSPWFMSRRAASADQAPPVNVPGIDKPVIVVTGEVTGTETWTSTNYYVLRGAVFVREGAHAEHPGGHARHRRVGQRRHADRRARRPAERHRHRGGADRLHQRPADRPARPRRLGRPHHQRPRAGQLRGRRGAPAKATPASTAAPTRTTTAASCATCASSSPASSSAPTTS